MELRLVMSGFPIFLTCCHSRTINTKYALRSLDTLGRSKYPKILGTIGQTNIIRSLDTLGNGNILRSLHTLGKGNILRSLDTPEILGHSWQNKYP